MAEITDIRIYKTKIIGPQKAFAAVTLDGEFAVHGIKVMENERGLWVSMPARRDARGEFRDIFHPITREAREKIIKAVIEVYERETSGEDERHEKGPEPSEETKVSVEEEVVGEEGGETEDLKTMALRLIKELDQGGGVKYMEIVEKVGKEEDRVEEALGELLADGKIYEPKIGRFKTVQI